MSSRKKPRPSFDLPDDTEEGKQSSGWVYRSENGHAHASSSSGSSAAVAEARETSAAGSILETGSYAIAYGFATMTQALALAMTIATLPLTIGARVLEEWGAERESATSTERPV